MAFVHKMQKWMGELDDMGSQKTACPTHLQLSI